MGIDGKMPAERLAELRITGVLKSAWLSQELGSHKSLALTREGLETISSALGSSTKY